MEPEEEEEEEEGEERRILKLQIQENFVMNTVVLYIIINHDY